MKLISSFGTISKLATTNPPPAEHRSVTGKPSEPIAPSLISLVKVVHLLHEFILGSAA
jgi:hypothetical protein